MLHDWTILEDVFFLVELHFKKYIKIQIHFFITIIIFMHVNIPAYLIFIIGRLADIIFHFYITLWLVKNGTVVHVLQCCLKFSEKFTTYSIIILKYFVSTIIIRILYKTHKHPLCSRFRNVGWLILFIYFLINLSTVYFVVLHVLIAQTFIYTRLYTFWSLNNDVFYLFFVVSWDIIQNVLHTDEE